MRDFNLSKSALVLSKCVSVFVFAVALNTSTSQAAELPTISNEQRAQAAKLLQHTPMTAKVESEFLDFNYGCVYERLFIQVVDPETNQEVEMKFLLTWPESKSPRAVVIDVPTIKGETPLEQKISTLMCDGRVATILADVNPTQFPKPNKDVFANIDKVARLSVHAVRTLIDYIERDPRLDAKNIVVLGTSLGGQTAAMVGAVDPRVKAVIIAASAGNTPALLATSDEKLVVPFRESVMRNFKIKSADEFESLLRQNLKIDPMYVVSPSMKQKTLQLIVTEDTHVPTAVQEELWRAMGQPQRVNMDGSGHAWSLIDLFFFHFDPIKEFLKAQFAL